MKRALNCISLKSVLNILCYLIVNLIMACKCYAVITKSSEIIIKCSESSEKASWYKYEGNKDIQYSLTTQGVRIAERPELVIYWTDEIRVLTSSDHIHVDAKCISPDGREHWADMWGPGKTLTCRRGEGLSVIMFSPNDKDADKYKYVGILTMTIFDEIEKEKTINGGRDESQSILPKMGVGNMLGGIGNGGSIFR